MNTVYYNGNEITTISEIANYYTDNDKELSKEIKSFIRTGVSKLKTIKLSKDEIEENKELLKDIIPEKIPTKGIIFVRLSDVKSIEKYFIAVLKRKAAGKYKKDRFLSKRSLIEEFKLELEKSNIQINNLEFSAVLSYITRLELGQHKKSALRDASKRFTVAQVRIKEILDSLNVQVDYNFKVTDHI